MNQDEDIKTEEEQLNNESEENTSLNSIELKPDEKEDQPKRVLKNIVMVAIGNLCTILAGILVGFLVPKMMVNGDSNIEYGFYKIFTLYLGYIGIFHLGFCDGILLVFVGKKYEELNKEQFRCYTRFFLVFETLIAAIILLGALPFFNSEYGFIFTFIAINLLGGNITEYYQQISQATGRFKELSLRNIIKAVLNSLIILVLYVMFKTNVINYLQFRIYIYFTTIVQWAISIWYIIRYRDITFGKAVKLKNELPNIKKLFIIGIPLLIANLVSGLILTIDRQFVSLLFNEEVYASYAFAYNMLNLITTATAAISIVLYPTLKRLNVERLKKNYNKFIAIISIFVGFCIVSYFPLHFIVTTWLDKYSESLPIFKVIMPGLMLSSCISMIMFNYYKTLGLSTKYFVISVIVLGLSILANVIAYLIYKTPIAISIASVIVMGIWYIITEFTLIRKWKINPLKNLIYIILIMTSFYLITYLIENIFIGFGIYLLVYVSLTVLFYFKLLKSKFKFQE